MVEAIDVEHQVRPPCVVALEGYLFGDGEVVHGGSFAKLNLYVITTNGERFLRDIWHWYFNQGMSLKRADEKIYRMILEQTEA